MKTKLDRIIRATVGSLFSLGLSSCRAKPSAQLALDCPSYTEDGDILFHSSEVGIYKLQQPHPNPQFLFSITGQAIAPKVSADEKWVVYSIEVERYREQLFLWDVTNKKSIRLTDNQFHDRSPIFSLTGDSVYFVRGHRFRPYSTGGHIWDDNDVFSLNLNTKAEKRLTEQNFQRCHGLETSVDSRILVFCALKYKQTDGCGVFVKDLNTEAPATLVVNRRFPGADNAKYVGNGLLTYTYERGYSRNVLVLLNLRNGKSQKICQFNGEVLCSKVDGRNNQFTFLFQSYYLFPQFVRPRYEAWDVDLKTRGVIQKRVVPFARNNRST